MMDPRRDLALPPPGAHGDDGPAVAAALGLAPGDLLDLAQTMNPVAPDVRPVVARHLDALGRYPDATAAAAALAAALGVAADQVVLTNGAAEAIALVAAEVGSARVDDPEFSLYRRHLPEVDPTAGRWRSNPHSPSGSLAGAGERAAVWDEAFYPLATGAWTRGDHRGGAWVIGSLTKLFSCPGLRVGYAIAPHDAGAARLRARQPRWAVNGLAAAAVPELVATADLAGWAETLAGWRDALVAVLGAHGIAARAGAAPWVLVAGGDLRARLAPHGVLVRDCTSFGLPGTFRLAVPDPAGLARLDDALGRLAPPPGSPPRRSGAGSAHDGSSATASFDSGAADHHDQGARDHGAGPRSHPSEVTP